MFINKLGKEEIMCGIFGIFGHPNAKNIACKASRSLKHRGKSAAGIACLDLKRREIQLYKDKGHVKKVLNPKSPQIQRLEGNVVIVHVRYPTTGADNLRNVQPHISSSIQGKIALSSNGDIVNLDSQKAFLEKETIRVYSDNDAELIAASFNWQVTIKGRNTIEAAKKVAKHVKGSYSCLMLTEFDCKLFAFRDPFGIRPLVYGKLDGFPVFASETCVLENIGATYIRDVQPGELFAISETSIETYQIAECRKKAFCVFELIYFARPDSKFEGESYQSIRKRMGAELAKEHPIKADMIIPVPKSGIPGAIGYAHVSGIPFDVGMIENPSPMINEDESEEIDRTFIGSSKEQRETESNEKYNIIADIVRGKKIVVVDDSIVRGLTMRKIIKKLRNAGTKEIHVRIPSPPIRFPCNLGIETKEKETLVAREGNLSLVRDRINHPDSLEYLSFEGMFKAIGRSSCNFCTACLDGNHPISLNGICLSY